MAGWYPYFNRIDNNRGKKLNHTRRVTGLDKLVESGNDPHDYSMATLFIGHKKLNVEFSALWGFSHFSVGHEVTTE